MASRGEAIASLQRVAVRGVAPPSRDWAARAPGRPTYDEVREIFGSWGAFCRAAALLSPTEAHRRRQREENDARRRAALAVGTMPESARKRWSREQREGKRAQFEQDVAEGRLVVRQASPTEMERFRSEREAAAARLNPPATVRKPADEPDETPDESDDEELMEVGETIDDDELAEPLEPVLEEAIA
jgi:hypothetical protein